MESLDKTGKLYVFGLDDVLFPRKDFILQVYYLFASFYEFTEQSVTAKDMLSTMKKVYEHHGEDAVFPALQALYQIDDKYKENFERLQANAALPLPLLIYPKLEELLAELRSQGKAIAILADGNPVEQLNKIRFIDWGINQDLRKEIKLFFKEELAFRDLEVLPYLAELYQIETKDIVLVDTSLFL
ncbi:HAD family hydrolase [Sphingobacterium sp. Mn56C]|uniref:HAD family hydrolase n=1 Tax=Sphingobacterium sp. Mn56C TaxID=3395261 RepID=UPI003BC30DB9